MEDSNDPEGDILMNAVSLNDIYSINYRRSSMLSLDYKLSRGTTLMLYGLYTDSRNENQRQSKNYGLGGAGSVGYSFASNPNGESTILQGSLSGESRTNFLNIKAEYGVSYSKGNTDNLDGRTWGYTFNNASSSEITDIEHRKMDPTEIVPLYTDDPENLLECWLSGLGVNNSEILDENLTAYLNFSVPFKLGNQVAGNVKFGGMYRQKNRFRDDQVGGQNVGANQFLPRILSDSLDWVALNSSQKLSAVGLDDEKIDNFLNGDYNYGYAFSMDRLNQLSDTWESVSDYYYALGPEVYLPIIGEVAKIGYSQNVSACILDDQDIQETYTAGYAMSEINFGKYVMFLPGVRLENTNASMKGFFAMPPIYTPPVSAPVEGSDTSATRSDQFVLPMIHLRIKPIKSFYMHFAYTQTLSRPDFNSISPNIFVNTGWAPFVYNSSNPSLRPELWTNYDAQLTFHGNKIGLLSVTAFYKTVEDKIWSRTYQRIKGDPMIDPFPDNAVVNVTVWENHAYTAFVNGLEFEWQTSFYYLPRP
ncbi:MAG: hypothetical protein IH594_01610, partial [Bacteroidales bacterium]|nr:hypothetical protein [Bacteroidales bacterium]